MLGDMMLAPLIHQLSQERRQRRKKSDSGRDQQPSGRGEDGKQCAPTEMKTRRGRGAGIMPRSCQAQAADFLWSPQVGFGRVHGIFCNYLALPSQHVSTRQ